MYKKGDIVRIGKSIYSEIEGKVSVIVEVSLDSRYPYDIKPITKYKHWINYLIFMENEIDKKLTKDEVMVELL